MARMVRYLSQWCEHIFTTRDRNIEAEFKKGARESFIARGDYQQCERCAAGRFLPADPRLSIVFCERVKS